MDRKVLHFDWHWQLHATAQELWPLLSDTNRLFNNLKLPAIQEADLSRLPETGHTQLCYNSIRNSDVWDEYPFEWERPYRFGVNRCYKNGAFRNLKLQVDLLPNDSGTRIRFQMWTTTRNSLARFFIPLKLKLIFRRRLKKTLHKFDKLAQKCQLPYETESPKTLARGGQTRLYEYQQELKATTGHPAIVTKLVELVSQARDIDLQSIAPFQLADRWGYPRDNVLSVFLHATDAGLLNFSWKLYCPQCRTPQERCNTLSQIHEPIFCDNCQEEFHINFNKNVQLFFRPSPLIRNISDEQYAITGPHSKPHIAVKQLLQPGEKRYLKVQLAEGAYNMRVMGEPGIARIQVREIGRENITISVTKRGMNGEQAYITPEPNLVFHNESDRQQIMILEKAGWNSKKLTAAQVTSLQLFRNLFNNEVPRQGEQIAVDNQTLMFTDLLDSTGMYDEEGDETATGTVIDHFDVLKEEIADQNGAVVKTIGDSVMAVFSNPVDAFRAFCKAHEVISDDDRFSNRLKLKAGIHHGSCVAVNLNNKIDYFGSTINLASRLVDIACADEVVLSESVGEIIDSSDDAAANYQSNNARVSLRGFEDKEFPVTRIQLRQTSLRLVV